MRTRIVWTPHELELVAEEAAKLLIQGATRSKMQAVSEGQKTALVDQTRWRKVNGAAAMRSIEFPLDQALSRLKGSKSSEVAIASVPTKKPLADKALLRAKLLASAQQFVDTLLELLDADSFPSSSVSEDTAIAIDPAPIQVPWITKAPFLEAKDSDLENEGSEVSPDTEDEDSKPDETLHHDSTLVAPFEEGFNDKWMTVAFAGVEADIRKMIEASFPSGLNFFWFETNTAGVQLFSKALDNKAVPIDYCLLKTGKQSTAFHLLASRRMQQRCLVVTGIADIRKRLEFLIKRERSVRNETET